MGSRRMKGGEDVRLPELSRRAVIAGTSVVAFGSAGPAAASAGLRVKACVALRVRRSSWWTARAGGIASAAVRYQSSSCSCRMIGNTSNICCAACGVARQSRPPNVTWETCWPAPKQSYTVQPGKPFRLRSW